MKRVLAIVLLFLTMLNMNINASDIVSEEKNVIEITPKYTEINSFLKDFDMLEGGKASYYVFLSSGVTDDVRLYGYIQQYKNGIWTTIHTISDKGTSGYAILSGNKYIASGYDYRLKVYGYAYVNGNLAESVTWISQGESY